MIIITIKFNKDKDKSYQYLLINPNHYKIDKDKPLVYTKGASYGKFEKVYIYPVEAQRVDSLPAIVTSQIRLLDENNTISVEKLGMVAETLKIKKAKPAKKAATETPIKKSATPRKKKKGYFDDLIEKETKKFKEWCRNYLMKSRW